MKKQYAGWLLGIGLAVLIVGLVMFDWSSINQYSAYDTSGFEYVRAKVLSVEDEELAIDEIDSTRYLGSQDITVLIQSGSFRGKTVEITNRLSRTWNVKVHEGQSIIVCVDAPEGVNPYFSVYAYNRAPGILIMIGLFIGAMVMVGGKKGLKAVAGLAVSIVCILFILVPAIFHGLSVVLVTFFVVILITFASLLILNGFERKTMLFIAGTLAGCALAAVFCITSQSLLKVSGYHFDDVEALVLIHQGTGLQVRHLLFAGVLISGLGAVMDVAVSIVSALYEVHRANPQLPRTALFRSGMNIGQDMIGTMSNTLILAFTGSSLTTMLILIAYGYHAEQLIHSNYLALELVQGIASTLAVILTVPAASAIAAAGIEYAEPVRQSE